MIGGGVEALLLAASMLVQAKEEAKDGGDMRRRPPPRKAPLGDAGHGISRGPPPTPVAAPCLAGPFSSWIALHLFRAAGDLNQREERSSVCHAFPVAEWR